jgi:TonB family protein
MPRHAAAAFVATLSMLLAAPELRAQVRRPAPLPPGNRIPAQHGDIIVLENDAQVKILRRHDANVRVIFSPSERWLVLLVDYSANGGPDGRVDWTHTYSAVSGDWPMEERWEGSTTIEEYAMAGMGSSGRGLGFTGPRGLVQLLAMPGEEFRDPAATAVLTYRGGGSGMAGGVSFDEAEARQIETARRNARGGTQVQTSSGGTMAFGVLGGVASGQSGRPVDGAAPVRVGGNIRQPEKLVDVPAVLPDVAARAGVRGVVIVEITIGTDGAVMDARVLRSIPLLDAAALEAVKQWRFAPTTLNGQPVPVIMTATVAFQ